MRAFIYMAVFVPLAMLGLISFLVALTIEAVRDSRATLSPVRAKSPVLKTPQRYIRY